MKERPRVWHWSRAEIAFLEGNYNSAAARHNRGDDWVGRVKWCDLRELFRGEPIVVRGALNFSLKSVAKALYALGKIDATWPEAQVDNGMSAMVAQIRCHEAAVRRNIAMTQVTLN